MVIFRLQIIHFFFVHFLNVRYFIICSLEVVFKNVYIYRRYSDCIRTEQASGTCYKRAVVLVAIF